MFSYWCCQKSWVLALSELAFLNANHVERSQKKHPHGVLENHVSLIEWSRGRLSTKDSSAKGRGAEINVFKVFWNECQYIKENCNAHFLRTKWYEWSTRIHLWGCYRQSLLAIKDIHDFFNLLLFKCLFTIFLLLVGRGCTRDITKVGCEVAIVAIPSWRLSLARSWPHHEFRSSPKWGQRSHGALSK